MVAREVYDHEIKRFKEVEAEHKDCASRIHVVEELSFKNLKAKNDIQNKLDDFSQKVQTLESDMRKRLKR